MTRAEARNLIRKELGETTAAFWSDAELNTWINLAGKDIAEKTLSIQAKGYVTTVLSQDEYDMPTLFSDFLTPIDVYMFQDGMTWQKLERRGIKEMDMEIPGWKTAQNGTPYRYIFEQERGKKLTLYVPPDANNSGTDYMEIYYARQFTPLTVDSADLSSQFIMAVLELALIDWVVATGLETRGLGDKANDKWSKFLSRINGYNVQKLKHLYEDEDIISRNYRR